MMMTKFSTICLTILFCISASICAAQSKDTTACLKLEETMQAGEEDAGRRIENTGRMIEEVQEKVVRQKKAMTAYRKALDPKVRTRRVKYGRGESSAGLPRRYSSPRCSLR